MPEASRVPTSQFKQGGTNLPWGEAAQLNDAVGLVPPPEDNQHVPQGDAEQFLFSPTDRPDEPVTAGQPYGPGHGPEMTTDNPDVALNRIAAQALQDPRAPKELKQFAARIQQGQ